MKVETFILIYSVKSFSGHLSVPDFIRNLPFIGKEISRTLNEINTDPNSTIQNIAAWVQSHLSYGRVLLNEISKISSNFVLRF